MSKTAKVFCVGAHKTGTTSTGEALAILGYAVFPEPLWYSDPSLRAEFYAGQYGRLSMLIDRYEAFEDSPFNHGDFYKWLFNAHPDAKFILTVRDTDHLISSHKRWLEKIRPILFARDPDLESYVRFFWKTEFSQNEFIDDEPAVRRIYEARNQAIQEFFAGKPGQLLTIDIESDPSPWERICGFLGKEVPKVPFPHLTRSK